MRKAGEDLWLGCFRLFHSERISSEATSQLPANVFLSPYKMERRIDRNADKFPLHPLSKSLCALVVDLFSFDGLAQLALDVETKLFLITSTDFLLVEADWGISNREAFEVSGKVPLQFAVKLLAERAKTPWKRSLLPVVFQPLRRRRAIKLNESKDEFRLHNSRLDSQEFSSHRLSN